MTKLQRGMLVGFTLALVLAVIAAVNVTPGGTGGGTSGLVANEFTTNASGTAFSVAGKATFNEKASFAYGITATDTTNTGNLYLPNVFLGGYVLVSTLPDLRVLESAVLDSTFESFFTTYVSGTAGQVLTSQGSGGAGWSNATASAATITQTNFVLNTVYSNATTVALHMRMLGALTVAAVSGDASLDIMADNTGGTTYKKVGGVGMSTLVTSIAMTYTNEAAADLAANAKYYVTNSSSGIGNSSAVVASSGQLTTLSGPAGATGATGATGTAGSSGGTNFPPVISNGGGQAASTNVTVGLGVRQSLAIITNASFKLVFSGTPLNGEQLKITVSNLSTTANIYVTNTAKFPAWASNVTVWPAVASNSFSIFTVVAETNLNTGTMEWVLESDFGKEMEFRADGASGGGFLVLGTNNGATSIAISNSYSPQGASAGLSNLVSSGIGFPISGTASNVASIISQVETRLIPTNSALSNIVVNFNTHTNTVELYCTNNLTFTNWTVATAGTTVNQTFLIRPQLITRGVNWGNLGLSNPGFGIAIATNANNLLWTSITNGKTYALSLVAVGTNIFPTMTLWE